MKPGRAIALAALLALVTACGKHAPETPAASAAAKPEPAFIEGLPRNQWLTAQTGIPPADGKEVRDEKRRPYSYALLGQTFPDFSAHLVGGGEVTQEFFRGKWTIVDVWGVWCGDCRRDGPLVKELALLAEADPDIEFISIHTPPSRARAAEAYGKFGSIEAYFESQGGGYPTIVDPDASLREALQIVWTPTYLLVAPDLTIHAFRTDLSVGEAGRLREVLAQAKSLQTASTNTTGPAL